MPTPHIDTHRHSTSFETLRTCQLGSVMWGKSHRRGPRPKLGPDTVVEHEGVCADPRCGSHRVVWDRPSAGCWRDRLRRNGWRLINPRDLCCLQTLAFRSDHRLRTRLSACGLRGHVNLLSPCECGRPQPAQQCRRGSHPPSGHQSTAAGVVHPTASRLTSPRPG